MKPPFAHFLRRFAAILAAAALPACIAGNAAHAGPPEFPSQWIVLKDRPEMHDTPGGTKALNPFPARALETVTADRRAEAGPNKTPWLHVVWGKGKAMKQGWLPEALLAPLPSIKKEDLAGLGEEPVDRRRGLPGDYAPADLVPLSGGYEKGRKYQLRRVAAAAYEKLRKAAAADDVTLMVVSAYRSYETQRTNYLKKLERSGWDQTTVAKPGHSEHQLGLTVDFTDGGEAALLMESFGDTKAGQWLRLRAPEFGFALSYTAANQTRTGYSSEPWHYRYYGPKKAPAVHKRALEGK